MTSLAIELIPLAQEVSCTGDELIVVLADGRTIKAPLVWFPRLFGATTKQRSQWELLGDGEGVHWPSLDEDISIEGLLIGNRAIERQPTRNKKRGAVVHRPNLKLKRARSSAG